MKKNIKILSCLFIVLVATLASCEKDEIVNTEDQVGISKVTFYADIVMKGDPYMSVVKGEAFVDSGATATEKGEPIDVKVEGSVDTNTPGIYIINYVAVNSDGYAASKSRTVAVLPSKEKAGVDLSGTYGYVGSSYKSTITKLAPGFYATDNVWGSTAIPANFICVDGKTIDIPHQVGGYGPIFGSGTLTADGALTYTVNLPAYGYSDVVRKWQME